MPELLLEVGTEELPASFVERAFNDLRDHLGALLTEAGVLEGTGIALGTPRRLIVSFPNVLARQPDTEKETRGPALKGAYDSEGKPTQSLLGFCRGQGVDVDSVRKDDTYVWVTKKIVGLDTQELLKELLPKAIRQLTFDKSMRWGSSRMRFARPIRRLLASFDSQLVPFDIEGVESGLLSCGHRFYSPETFTATNLESLVAELKARKVEVDSVARRESIIDQAKSIAEGTPDLPDALVDENAFLTEWPTAIQGTFKEAYLELPAPVLVTAMAKHEKMFPVRDSNGNLTNRFVFIRNSGEDDSVRKGCEWVLNARFNDAKFFFDEDRKSTLADFLAKTEGIVYQQKLGTIRQRAGRLAALASLVAERTGGNVETARQAGLYAKADLSTGLVGELPALQGIVGGHYARLENFEADVCWAIETHYDVSKNASDLGSARSSAALAVTAADQLDKLGGYLGLGLAPTGSSDPYALRRAATMLIELALSWPAFSFDIADLVGAAVDLYTDQGIELDRAKAINLAEDLFATRYTALLGHVRHDLLEAAIFVENRATLLQPQRILARVDALKIAVENTELIQTATRPINIVAAAKKKGIEVGVDDPLAQVHEPHLESVEGITLKNVLAESEAALAAAGPAEVVSILSSYVAPVNAFFDGTMMMVDDANVRFARLTLLEAASRQFLALGDVTKIVVA